MLHNVLRRLQAAYVVRKDALLAMTSLEETGNERDEEVF